MNAGFDRWRRVLHGLAGVLLAVALATSAWADPPGRVGRLAEYRGAVWLFDAEAGDWTDAVRNRPVTTGDRLWTDRDARAVVQIGSTTLRLAGDSEIEWLQLDDAVVRIAVHAGSVALRVRSAEVARQFEVVLPQGRYLPLVAGHFRIDRFDDASAGQTLVGQMAFESADSRKLIDPGQRFDFWQRGDPPVTHYDAVTATDDEFGLWLLAEERREPTNAVATRYVSPEMTGWSDLDRYGVWETHPSYGAVWIPWGVSVGWAPYRYGRWVWVRPWGWTWVDDAPWGFAPFHYGRWVWWGTRWVWAPGAYVAWPVYAPALVGWIGGSVGVSISVGVGPWVGWVPLAPYDVYQPWYPVSPRHPHYRPRPVPRPYAHLSTPGGVTVVSTTVVTGRQPIGERDLRRIDPDELRRVAARVTPGVPPAPTARPSPPPGSVPSHPPYGGSTRREADPRRERVPAPLPPAARPDARSPASAAAAPGVPPVMPRPDARSDPRADGRPGSRPDPQPDVGATDRRPPPADTPMSPPGREGRPMPPAPRGEAAAPEARQPPTAPVRPAPGGRDLQPLSPAPRGAPDTPPAARPVTPGVAPPAQGERGPDGGTNGRRGATWSTSPPTSRVPPAPSPGVGVSPAIGVVPTVPVPAVPPAATPREAPRMPAAPPSAMPPPAGAMPPGRPPGQGGGSGGSPRGSGEGAATPSAPGPVGAGRAYVPLSQGNDRGASARPSDDRGPATPPRSVSRPEGEARLRGSGS